MIKSKIEDQSEKNEWCERYPAPHSFTTTPDSCLFSSFWYDFEASHSFLSFKFMSKLSPLKYGGNNSYKTTRHGSVLH